MQDNIAISTGYHVTHRLFKGGRRIRVDDLKIATTDLKIVLFTFLIVGEITIFGSQYNEHTAVVCVCRRGSSLSVQENAFSIVYTLISTTQNWLLPDYLDN